MTDLSIVIVSYNVKFFTSQCLTSIYNSTDTLLKEIIVVDNASDDHSAEFIQTHYPKVRLIKNQQNVGFSKANNQGFAIAHGEYILILNPDTILEKDTIQKCYDFLKSNVKYGAVGVKMTDGKGNYLPESKRSLPDLMSSFFKFTQLNSIFSKNPFFNKYYLGHLDENQDHDVEVLTGAFIFTKKSIIEEVSGFDEAYFMYGEDIDLCKKIIDKGYKIRYLSSTKIIHFKGESTKKNSFKYISSFYGAMKIYTSKHTNTSKKPYLNLAFNILIIILASFNGIKLFLMSNFRLILGLALALICFMLSKWIWANYYFENPKYFNDKIYLNLIIYSLITIFCIWFTGWFDKNNKTKYLIVGTFISLTILLMIYSVLPEYWRFSRAIIFLGLTFTSLSLYLVKYGWDLLVHTERSVIVVSTIDQINFLKPLLALKLKNFKILGFVQPSSLNYTPQYLDNIDQLSKIIIDYQPDIVIFNSKEISISQISHSMTIPSTKVRYLLTGIDDSSFIEPGESFTKSTIWELEPIYNLAKPIYRRTKYTIDIFAVFVLIICLPFTIFRGNKSLNILKSLLVDHKTLVGYANSNQNLPIIKSGILNTQNIIGEVINGEIVDSMIKSDICYAKYYSPLMDLNILYKVLWK